jgi:hypothetical protein
MNTTAKIISLFEQIETPKEWEDVFMAARIIHENFNKQQRIMRNNKIKEEERQKNAALKAQWKEGDRVKFYARKYYINCMGVIIKRNPKRAKVQVYVGRKGVWSIPYQHLNKIIDKNEILQLTIEKMGGKEMMATIINV